MNKSQAIFTFLEGFGLPVYDATSVPTEAKLPYITYSLSTGSLGDGDIIINPSLWYRTESNRLPDTKVEEISAAIGSGGRVITITDGAVWIKRGSPFSQSMGDGNDLLVKRRYLNLRVEYLTTD